MPALTRRRQNPDGNHRLTAAVGVLLLLLTLAELGTLLVGAISWHVFIGLALIPPVLLKLASTGWRFTRYYTRSHPYREQGPPKPLMRLTAPLLVLSTLALFGSGVGMGTLHGQAQQLARGVHGPAATLWLGLVGLHLLVYLRRALRSVRAESLRRTKHAVSGHLPRRILLVTAVAAGIAVAVGALPQQHRWLDLHHDDRPAATLVRH
jgi:cytochrome b561-like protein